VRANVCVCVSWQVSGHVWNFFEINIFVQMLYETKFVSFLGAYSFLRNIFASRVNTSWDASKICVDPSVR